MNDIKKLWLVVMVMVMVTVVSSGGTSSWSLRYIAKREATASKCAGGTCELKQGPIIKAKSTEKSIEAEAHDGKHDDLRKTYEKLSTESYMTEFTQAKASGRAMGLSEEETRAIFMYTMDNDDYALYKSFNRGFREGRDAYPIFHFWLQRAVDKLPTYSGSTLYRGYSIHLNATIGEEMSLSGFTSVSKVRYVAEGFREPGCTLIRLTTNKGVDIENLSAHPHEREVLIPPQEKFRVTDITTDDPQIYLRPVGVVRRSINQPGRYNVCCGSDKQLSLELIVATILCSLTLSMM